MTTEATDRRTYLFFLQDFFGRKCMLPGTKRRYVQREGAEGRAVGSGNLYIDSN